MNPSFARGVHAVPLLLIGALVLAGCKRNMYEEPKFLPDQQNYYFPGEQVDRKPVDHTVPRGPVDDGAVFYTGKTGDILATNFPVPVTLDLVKHGQELFDINCSACHGRDGYGEGIVVKRGFPQPPSYHSERLRNAPIGHFFEVITDGYGVMYPFGSRISPADRWAIISYIRALQLSQDATAARIEPTDEAQLEKVK
jgi:mono/diheme cytochrome c family protein